MKTIKYYIIYSLVYFGCFLFIAYVWSNDNIIIIKEKINKWLKK